MSFRILSKNLTAVFLRKKKIVMNRAYSVGFSILELSKLLMYECYYDKICPKLGSQNVEILMSDTDSFIMNIKNHTQKKIFKKIKNIMDFSNFPKNNKLYSNKRAKVPGFMKSEVPRHKIQEFIGLKSKVYALRSQNKNEEYIDRKCKGINKARTKKIKLNSYRNCITNMQTVKATMTKIQSKNDIVRTVAQSKICLSSFDDKRFLLQCGKHSIPHGSKLMNLPCRKCDYNL